MFSNWRITRTGILFIVGIIVLAGLVTGGIFLVRDRGEQVRRQEAVKVAEKNLESQSKTQTETKPEANNGTVSAPVTTDAESQSTSTVATTSSTTTALPQTGADASEIIVIAILALALGYYVTSRRAVRGL